MSESKRSPASENPYASSHVADATTNDAPSGNPERALNYHARLAWSDRRSLLRAVAPMRLATVLLAVQWVKGGYDSVVAWTNYIARGGLASWVDLLWFALAVANLAQGVLTLYALWLAWVQIDLLRRWAGGHSPNLQRWTQLTYQTGWLSAIAAALGLAGYIGLWFESRQ